MLLSLLLQAHHFSLQPHPKGLMELKYGFCFIRTMYNWMWILQVQEELYEKLNGSAEGRIRIWFGLRQILNSTDSLLLKTKEAADRHKTGIHMVLLLSSSSFIILSRYLVKFSNVISRRL